MEAFSIPGETIVKLFLFIITKASARLVEDEDEMRRMRKKRPTT
jgi:hypothetical protein